MHLQDLDLADWCQATYHKAFEGGQALLGRQVPVSDPWEMARLRYAKTRDSSRAGLVFLPDTTRQAQDL